MNGDESLRFPAFGFCTAGSRSMTRIDRGKSEHFQRQSRAESALAPCSRRPLHLLPDGPLYLGFVWNIMSVIWRSANDSLLVPRCHRNVRCARSDCFYHWTGDGSSRRSSAWCSHRGAIRGKRHFDRNVYESGRILQPLLTSTRDL